MCDENILEMKKIVKIFPGVKPWIKLIFLPGEANALPHRCQWSRETYT